MAGLFFASFFTGIRGAGLLVCAAAGFFFIGKYRGLERTDYIIAVLVFVAACCHITLYGALRKDPVTAFDGKTGSYSGTVTGISDHTGGKSTYTLKGRINGSVPAKVTLYTDTVDVRYGDRISAGSCKFTVPENDYLYNTRSRLMSEGVFITAASASDIQVERLGRSNLRNRLAEYRSEICSDLMLTMDEESGSFLAGMMFGKASDAPETGARAALARCGIAHILAVSGLHITLAAAGLMWLLGLFHMGRIAEFAVMNVFLVLLILMTESPVSAVRAAIMADMICTAKLFRRQTDVFTSLSAAVLLICLSNPYVIYSPGFHMSAAGTFGIGVFAPYMTKNIPDEGLHFGLLRAFISVLCVNICVMPLGMKYFEGVSLIAPAADLLLLPLCTIVLAAGYIFLFTGGMLTPLLVPARYIITLVIEVSDRLARVNGVYFTAGSSTVVRIAFAAAVIIVLIQIVASDRRITGVCTAAALCAVFISSFISGNIRSRCMTIAVLGRGSKAAVVITSGSRADVIDLSGDYRSPYYVRKYLMRSGYKDVSGLFLTERPHSQYTSYLGALEYIDCEKIYTYVDTYIYGVESENWGDRGFSFSYGTRSVTYDRGILTAGFGKTRISILPSGTEADSEAALCVWYGGNKSADAGEGMNVGVNCDNNFEIILYSDGEYSIRRL